MTETNTTETNENERQALLAGLDALRKRSREAKLTALVGPPGQRREHVRTQMRVTPLEHAMLCLARHTISFHVGRPVAGSLVNRLALGMLIAECRRSLKDPVVAARLRAGLIAAREERVLEHLEQQAANGNG